MKFFRTHFIDLFASWLLLAIGSAIAADTLYKPAPDAKDAGVRVAVVIGNSRYPSGALENPKNDAAVMAAALKKFGFDVELKIDATKSDLDGLFKRFGVKAEKSAVALVFYAGHGVQVNGINFLIPIDAAPQNERDLKRELVRLDDVIDDMASAKVKLIFFDACRDNPFARSFSRGSARGLAAPAESSGTLISFSTKHGNTAADGDGKNSPYTSALLAVLESQPQMEIEQMLRKVQQEVKRLTRGQQEPWRYGSLDGDFYFRSPEVEGSAALSRETVDKAISEAVAEAVKKATEHSDFQQRANQQAVVEALKVANEQAAREKAELEKRAEERIARERAEAEYKAAERFSRERAELKESMERMLKEAMDRQNSQLQLERDARRAAGEKVSVQVLTEPLAHNKPLESSLRSEKAQEALGSAVQPAVVPPLSIDDKQLGDEWEYVIKDQVSGLIKNRIRFRTTAATSERQLEEVSFDGLKSFDWVFHPNKASAVAISGDSTFVFGPLWNGKDIPAELLVEGGRGFCNPLQQNLCRLSLTIVGHEQLSLSAGTFDAIRLDGWLTISCPSGSNCPSGGLRSQVWYSIPDKRMLKQEIRRTGGGYGTFGETVELVAIRKAMH
ncbi:caspase family protein [Propionivibrio dicarboxylicus]|uniref:Caspase domain-containing protein n=1 Tax=Propionivibrio dicarboxylicus TaxID=83767 RepID=A0A1G7VHD1_9RHOO|nr:caspase family protein [Propionivibrio dicarboxylicus]SDG58968.1 Caspase domain-containing protein [Propionivibrio dicarboxylicus]